MKLDEVLRLTAFGTKIAVRKDEKVQHIVYEEFSDKVQFSPLMNEEV